MQIFKMKSRECPSGGNLWRQFAASFVLILVSISLAHATENEGCVYPIGAETVMPGVTPAPGQTVFAEFNTTYQANQLVNGQGQNTTQGFSVAVYAVAPKIIHNWGIHLLGGTLVSWVATPIANEQLNVLGAAHQNTELSNPIFGVADIAYNKGSWHWWYGLDVETPAPGFQKNNAINIGQHNYATNPVFAFTYLPAQGKVEISSRIQYIVNYTDSATQYRSGNEFIAEYAGMRSITKNLAIGAAGYLYQQTTDDRLNNFVYESGNRGRDMAIGPQIQTHWGRTIVVAKYFRDTLVENRPLGNAYWVELAVPLSHRTE